jgi:hypothetical protein
MRIPGEATSFYQKRTVRVKRIIEDRQPGRKFPVSIPAKKIERSGFNVMTSFFEQAGAA